MARDEVTIVSAQGADADQGRARAAGQGFRLRSPVLKACLDCGRPTSGSRCPRHRREHERRRGTPDQRGYDKQHRAMRRQAIDAHPYCVDCGTSEDLCADHIVPLSRGGTNALANYAVRCRRCISRRGVGSPDVVEQPAVRTALRKHDDAPLADIRRAITARPQN